MAKAADGHEPDRKERDRPQIALEVLSATGHQATTAEGHISITGHDSDPARINSILVHAGIAVSRITVEQPSLEDLFLEITDSEMLQECASR